MDVAAGDLYGLQSFEKITSTRTLMLKLGLWHVLNLTCSHVPLFLALQPAMHLDGRLLSCRAQPENPWTVFKKYSAFIFQTAVQDRSFLVQKIK